MLNHNGWIAILTWFWKAFVNGEWMWSVVMEGKVMWSAKFLLPFTKKSIGGPQSWTLRQRELYRKSDLVWRTLFQNAALPHYTRNSVLWFVK